MERVLLTSNLFRKRYSQMLVENSVENFSLEGAEGRAET